MVKVSGAKRLCLCRRHFLQGVVWGSLGLLVADPVNAAEKPAKVLVLGCIDYRFVQTERFFLASLNLSNQYDWTALAGASLALSGYPREVDREAFWDQLSLSQQRHGIQKVMILDHQDCTAFAMKYGSELSQNTDKERQLHTEALSQAYWQILDRFPSLEVELYFITADAEIKGIRPLPKPQLSPSPNSREKPWLRWYPRFRPSSPDPVS